MRTREDIGKDYTVSADGRIASLGKFEGESWYAVALWELALDGGSDLEIGGEGSPSVSWWRIDEALTNEIPEIKAMAESADPPILWIGIYSSEQGFVYVVTSATTPEDESEDPE